MKAIAKTNLFLSVLGKRSDSYHDLENVFVPLSDVYDEVELASGKGAIALEVEGASLSTDRGNLCLKAADAFCEASGCFPEVNIHLRKNIPIAAGLGGGSSDAAAVLLLLNEHCGFPLNAEQLKSIASKLGADVPFFLHPVPSLGTGIGDVLSPIELNVNFAVIMVAPCFPLPVRWTFSHLVGPAPDAPSLQRFLDAARGSSAAELAKACRNDLETAVFNKFPLLCAMRDCLLKNGALAVHVSGSGPSLFAISEIERASSVASSFYSVYGTFRPPCISVFQYGR